MKYNASSTAKRAASLRVLDKGCRHPDVGIYLDQAWLSGSIVIE